MFNVSRINNSNVVLKKEMFKNLTSCEKAFITGNVYSQILFINWLTLLDFNIFCVFVCFPGFVCGLLEKASGPPSSSMGTPPPPSASLFSSPLAKWDSRTDQPLDQCHAFIRHTFICLLCGFVSPATCVTSASTDLFYSHSSEQPSMMGNCCYTSSFSTPHLGRFGLFPQLVTEHLSVL